MLNLDSMWPPVCLFLFVVVVVLFCFVVVVVCLFLFVCLFVCCCCFCFYLLGSLTFSASNSRFSVGTKGLRKVKNAVIITM